MTKRPTTAERPLASLHTAMAQGAGAVRWARLLLVALLALPGALQAQQDQAPAVVDPVSRELGFVDWLAERRLFEYADLALRELEATGRVGAERLEVARAGIWLVEGKTSQVEQMLAGKNLATDLKAQAILLQLGMRYDSTGDSAKATGIYQQFLDLNRDREISDPDVIRYFASAGFRLGALLHARGDFQGVVNAYHTVRKTTDSKTLQRKFTVLIAQTHVDFARTLSGSARDTQLAYAEKTAEDLEWVNDNYFFMSVAVKAQVRLLQGRGEEGLQELRSSAKLAGELEKLLEEGGVPLSEHPRASMRYTVGLILFEQAKAAWTRDDKAGAISLAKNAANEFYNSFLKYPGNEYGKRAGLAFEEVKGWLAANDPSFVMPDISKAGSAVVEQVFRSQLDLAGELILAKKYDEAESILLRALNQYPVTQYTLRGLNLLARCWLAGADRDWDLQALAGYLAEQYPDQAEAVPTMLQIGKKFLDEGKTEETERLFLWFGTRFVSDPKAPALLFRIGFQAGKRGDGEIEQRFYDAVTRYHPQSAESMKVYTLQAVEALKAENFEVAEKAFAELVEKAPAGFHRGQAQLGQADAMAKSGDPAKGLAAIELLTQLKKDLDPSVPNSLYYMDAETSEKSTKLRQDVRFLLTQVYLRVAREAAQPALREQASSELASFLADYPKADKAPEVMYSLGRLYLQQKRISEAVTVFSELSERYKDSDKGRDALYSLVRAAMDEGMVDVAESKVREMVQIHTNFDAPQFFRVGQLMLDEARFDSALACFDVVLEHKGASTNATYEQRGLYGRGMAAVGAGQVDKAVADLEALLQKYPTSTIVVPAGMALSDAYLATDPPDTVKAMEVLGPVGAIVNQAGKRADRMALDLQTAKVQTAAGDLAPALASYYRAATFKPEDEAEGKVLKGVLEAGVALAERMALGGEGLAPDPGKWAVVMDFAETYTQRFPLDRRSDYFRQKASEARMKNL